MEAVAKSPKAAIDAAKVARIKFSSRNKFLPLDMSITRDKDGYFIGTRAFLPAPGDGRAHARRVAGLDPDIDQRDATGLDGFDGAAQGAHQLGGIAHRA